MNAEIIPPRKKLRITLPRCTPPKEKPLRTCMVCAETKPDWQFYTHHDVCSQCGYQPYSRPSRGLPSPWPGFDLKDEAFINVICALVAALEGKYVRAR